jgi:oxygen-independent coproporphyrinogen-3 oxidase
MEARYLDALRAEIDRHEWAWRPETVYLGGGTPSAMDPEALADGTGADSRPAVARSYARNRARHRHAGTARAWVEAGIDRVSLGVQSFVSGRLRARDASTPPKLSPPKSHLLRAAGIAKINIDLIAGLSGQTAASWRESLDWIARLEPDHVFRLHAGSG